MTERKCSVCAEPGHTKRTCVAHNTAADAPQTTVETAWERPTAANVQMPAPVAPAVPDPFETVDEPPAPERPKTDNRYGYLIIDPVLGKPRRHKKGTVKGITRCTTFVKAASDRTALTEWNKRNVLIGASRRPDLVLEAHGLTHADKGRLGSLVEQLEVAAGAKVASALGTAIHRLTEEIDRGDITLDGVPEAYKPHIMSYVQALTAAGFRVMPDLMERTVFVPEFDGVVGTYDRVLYHIPSGTYVMGDLKTGKNMEYGWDEIEAQEAIYARGYNQFGNYVWGDDPECSQDRWEEPRYQVRTDVGVVMWLPVEGDTAGQCQLLMTDLERGWRYVHTCGHVREQRNNKGKPDPWSPPGGLPVGAPRNWEAEFGAVISVKEAGELWSQARAAGLQPTELGALVKVAQDALRSLGVTS
jgi:hypothetical protein